MSRGPNLFSIFFVFLSFFRCVATVDVLDICYEECTSRVVLDEDDFDVACNDTCKIQKCQDGCELWIIAVSTSCQDVCQKDTDISKRWGLYCSMGCNLATTTYVQNLEVELGTPSAPYLVADSRTNDSVTIQWAPAPYRNISFLVQWRYEAHPSDWEYYRPHYPFKTNKLHVQQLHPYTKYKFRVAWILISNYSPLLSDESVAISTLPYGVPSTAPVIVSLTAVGPTRVSVSWDPPVFPNGPILSYVLYLQESPSGYKTIKDVSDTSRSGLHYMFNNLRPETTYSISVATRNNMGEGPADKRNITTPPKSEASNIQSPRPFLVFGARQNVVKQGFSIFDETLVLYQPINDSVLITGVALHVKANIFFLSDSVGYVHKIPLTGEYRIDTIIASRPSNPTILAVDWLNNRLYMVEDRQISRSDFEGKNYEIAVTGFDRTPSDIQVDPYNGYLYWALHGEPSGGLYRIDLEKVDFGVVSHEECQHILKDSMTSAFAVDYKNFRLLVPQAEQNTIVSVALDGNDGVNIRHNSQIPRFSQVKSLAVHNGLFYWTTGFEVYGEEYHYQEDKYYNNAYLLKDGPFSNIRVLHADSQPHPVPLNPVIEVQAVFEVDMAKIAWSKPKLLGGLGSGAWQKWLYEVHLLDFSSELTIFGMNISDTSYTFHNLRPNTLYSAKVRAYSMGGKGPWSAEFIGKTLKQDLLANYPFVLWSAREGLLKSNIVGDNVEPLIHKINLNNAHITDISWKDGLLFLNTNSSLVYTYNISSHHSLSRLNNISNAASIAVDWLAPKLYWSSPVQQMISRSNLDGSQPEPLPLLTLAQELAIDSPSGYLYWATSHSVEYSRLNGAEQNRYFQAGLFSGKHVMGLTLDFDRHRVYWMVRSYEGSVLYRAPFANEQLNSAASDIYEVGSLPEDDVRGPLWYFSDRLFWLHERNEALISDMSGQNVACLKGLGLTGLKTLAIVDPSLQPYPDLDSIHVVPEPIPEKGIVVKGTWDSFNITWQSVSNVNYGTLFYEMKVDDGQEVYTVVTEDQIFVYPSLRHLSPYTPLTLAIRAYTFWASSRQTAVTIHSPMSIPTKPVQPRVFITYKSLSPYEPQQIQAEFRWSPPEFPNGVILGYSVSCWFFQEDHSVLICSDVPVEGKKLKYIINDLLPNTTYYFKVRAHTMVGEGPSSDVVETHTSQEHPVPKLLLAKTHAVKMADVDAHEEQLLSSKASQPVAVAYLAQERKVFWLEEGGALISSGLDGSNTTLVRSLSSAGTSLAVDWIGRHLYWTERDKEEHLTTVWTMDLSYMEQSHSVFNKSDTIGTIEVEPFSGNLLWTMMNEAHVGQLMTCDIDGHNIRQFFWQSSEYKVKRGIDGKKMCTCPPRPSVGKALTVDRSNMSNPQILWVDGRYGHIWASDLQGCICHLLVNATGTKDNGLPPSSLTVDSSRIYWSNSSLDQIYSIQKDQKFYKTVSITAGSQAKLPSASHYKNHIVIESVIGVRGIRAIGDHLQPYPDATCLYPISYHASPNLTRQTSSSLTLTLPPMERPSYCQKISMASVLYTIYYKKVGKDEYKTLKTYNSTVVIYGLQPFTNYSFQVAISNYYSQGITSPGPEVIYQTKEGAPTAPVNVTADPVTPIQIDVHWQPPLAPNGDPIWYEVRWRTDGSHKSGKSAIYNQQSEKYMMSLLSLTPVTKYFIVVRAYSSGWNMHNDSQEITAVTFELPNNLTLVDVLPRSITISWLSPVDYSITDQIVEYALTSNMVWNVHSRQHVEPSELYNFTIGNLHPKTDYSIRLVLTYSNKDVNFIWPQNIQQFTYQTLGDRPDVPGMPHINRVGKDVYQVLWEEVPDNGGELLVYQLQLRALDEDFEWITVYNNSNTQWIIKDQVFNTKYEFRVQAINEYGESNFSAFSEYFFLPEPGAVTEIEDEQVTVILASTLSVIFLITAFLAVAAYTVYKQREKDKKILEAVAQNLQNPDVELATLQELPQNSNFVHQNNALYNLGDIPSDEELATLPHIQRDQIILTKFLGSGAFGEVFEGIAHELYDEDTPPTRVAIKTLRKGATDQEKGEFLKEAKLMSNFKHEHILRLLGICLDNNPNFIILELMEGGDLLSFLRSHRPTMFASSSLMLDDLLGICVDVAKGCEYLEEMHFVHRDLAARNCLVSSLDPATRVVKIGDFGLARDIYKNDYYRKEGEGLLPVRWMAPESLVDGVFTSQSDVWAFGVLLWEVMTLGQQPYPARTNLEVLHYVRGGGRLDKPDSCPDDLHELMLECWSYDPKDRPTFPYCLNTLEDLRTKSAASEIPITTVHNQNYLNHNGGRFMKTGNNRSRDTEFRPLTLPKDVDNLSTCSDPLPPSMVRQEAKVKRTSSLNSEPMNLFRENSIQRRRYPSYNSALRKYGAQSNGESAKYLELLADTDDVTDIDGYEIPLPALAPKKSGVNQLHYAEIACRRSVSSCSSSGLHSPSILLSKQCDNPDLCLPHQSTPPVYGQVFPKSVNLNGLLPTLLHTECQNTTEHCNCSIAYSSNHSSIVEVPSSELQLSEAYDTNTSCVISCPNEVPCLPSTSSQHANTSKEDNPLYHNCVIDKLDYLHNRQRYNASHMSSSIDSLDVDWWSLSTASTAPCNGDSSYSSNRNSGISSLSVISGIDLDYIPQSSWC